MSGNMYNADAVDTYVIHVNKLRRRYKIRIHIINPVIYIGHQHRRQQFEDELTAYLTLHMTGQWEYQRIIYDCSRDHFIWFMLTEDALVAKLAWSGKVV
jgi:hypothetical protein